MLIETLKLSSGGDPHNAASEFLDATQQNFKHYEMEKVMSKEDFFPLKFLVNNVDIRNYSYFLW